MAAWDSTGKFNRMRETILNKSNQFGAPWGRALKAVSVIACVLLIAMPCAIVAAVQMPLAAKIITVATSVLIVAGSAGFMVLGFEIENGVLLVKRPGWMTAISLVGLESVEFDPLAMKGAIRVMGNGGLFAFNGLFWSKRFGRFRVYLNDFDRAVILKFADRVVVVAPDDPERFVEACGSLIKSGPLPARV